MPSPTCLARGLCACLLGLTVSPVLHAVDNYNSSTEKINENLTHFSSEAEKNRQPEEDMIDELQERQYLLGDTGGWREDLADYGLAIDLSFAMNLAGNPVGGDSRGFTQLNSTGLNFGVDLEKLAGLEGLSFFSSLSVRSGTSLTLSHIHNVINVQQLYGNESYRLVNLYLEQVLLDGHFSIKAGRIAQFDDFSHSDAFAYYMNNAFDGQPVGFFFMGPFTAYPVTTWGALIRGGVPTGQHDGFYGMVGAYGADSNQANVDNHGTDFTFNFDQGANIMGELGYKLNWSKYSSGLPGKYALGAWMFTGPFTTNSGGTTDNIGGLYYFIEQNLYREGVPEQVPNSERMQARQVWGQSEGFMEEIQGLYFWTTGQFNLSDDVNQADLFASAGLYYRGLLPGRDQDILSLGAAWLNFSSSWGNAQRAAGQPVQDYEVELELSYRYQVTNYFYLQPNIQGVINPGAANQFDDALVIGLQLQVDF
ncbi:carbohydrate porin [Ruficoccus amylovorans]|uniref:Carbohydrate porin n=1 Tax=Ruficoccus amylovorans TaxID=1804625 RepID=A0A842HJ95_9BACT|nr:carbohydrate porin [Ruficoccus amylovorans]MBC2596210.1 carbohydrate porin [Ruficoccus amylovorans]